MLILNRLCSSLLGTHGVFIYDRKVLCHTLELPWLGNIQNKSCIPEGQYSCVRHYSARHGDVYRLLAVPGRSDILIHPGNDLTDTRGCILPGLDTFDGRVLSSRSALSRLYRVLPANFELIVRS